MIEETEAAIKAAKTVGEVESVFAAAHEKYKDIATTKDHEDAWTSSGKLLTAYNKADYGTQIEKYAAYLMSTVDASKYGMNANDLVEVAVNELYKAYDVSELDAKFADAKAAMLGCNENKG